MTDTATTTATITLGSGSFDAIEATIEGLGLEPAGIENSLLKKLQNAQKSFDKADGEACEKLASFIAAVNAQDGKKLTHRTSGPVTKSGRGDKRRLWLWCLIAAGRS